MSNLTAERLRSLLYYDQATGIFIWKTNIPNRMSANRVIAETVAGKIDNRGYVVIQIGGRPYQAHRLAWFYMKGEWPSQIDHRDMNGINNRWSNLREATYSQNNHNKKAQKNNRLGIKGVIISNHKTRPYLAKITVGGRRISLGFYATADEARAAYADAAKAHLGEFARST